MACVTIWANSIAAIAGDNQPLLDNTSTHAWINLNKNKSIFHGLVNMGILEDKIMDDKQKYISNDDTKKLFLM